MGASKGEGGPREDMEKQTMPGAARMEQPEPAGSPDQSKKLSKVQDSMGSVQPLHTRMEREEVAFFQGL